MGLFLWLFEIWYEAREKHYRRYIVLLEGLFFVLFLSDMIAWLKAYRV